MRERDAHRTASSNPPDRCEECKSNPAKYKCPGCSIRSCSLPCVKAHKHRTGCTGKKNATTQFVSLSQFDDNLLLSDFKFLEGAKRVSESAKRLRSKLFGYEAAHFTSRTSRCLKILCNAAASRRTRLFYLPRGMSMRAKNQSQYYPREKTIFWTIEWRFHSTDVVLHDHGVNENMSMCSIIQNHLKPSPWNHQLRKFCEVQLDHLKLFIRENLRYLKSPYRQLDMKAPLREQFANLRILEYPVIYVFLPSHDINFEVVQGANAFVRHVPFDSNQIPHGVPFREEEINEAASVSAEPQVLEFRKHVNSSPKQGVEPHQGPENTESSELEEFENMEFDFDQGLIDAYIELVSQINPDELRDLGNGFLEEMDGAVKTDVSDLKGIFSADDDEELEEGEIAG